MARTTTSRTATRRNRKIETRSRSLDDLIQRWLAKNGRRILYEEMATLGLRKRRLLRIAKQRETPEAELLRIIRAHGIRFIDEAAKQLSEGESVDLFRARALEDFMAGKEVLVQGILAETRRAVRESLRIQIADALREVPTPSTGEIARRIHRQYHGPVDKLPFEIGPERASLIARTELAQAQNSGIDAGFEATGVMYIEWLAYTDGKSGDRHHERMNGVIIRRDSFFVTPLGNQLRFPADPRGPIKETANCRCTPAAVHPSDPRIIRLIRQGKLELHPKDDYNRAKLAA